MLESNLYNADANISLRSIPDNSIDLIFIDPPYNTTDLKMDKDDFCISNFLYEFERIIKPNGWFFVFAPIDMQSEIICSKIFKRKFDYIWVKQRSTINRKDTIAPMQKHEILCAYYLPSLKRISDLYMDKFSLRVKGDPYRSKRRINLSDTEYRRSQRYFSSKEHIINNGYREGTTVLQFNNKQGMLKQEKTKHPTQKPLDLAKLICTAYCPENGVVLDSFMGSGTIPLAAACCNRKFIGIEKEYSYFRIAVDRFYKLGFDLESELM